MRREAILKNRYIESIPRAIFEFELINAEKLNYYLLTKVYNIVYLII